MRIFKKNQIIISVVALMFIAAGYLNYSSQISEEVANRKTEEGYDYAGIGDAKLVDSELVVGEENNIKETMANNSSEDTNNVNTKEENTKNENENIANNTSENNTVETNANGEEDYFTSSKLQRENMYSQMLETYQKILENTAIPETQKSISSQEIANINNKKNAIMIAENLIKTKGFEDAVIFVNDDSVSVVVKAEKLEQNQIAQIQNIISRELTTEISNIHISTK